MVRGVGRLAMGCALAGVLLAALMAPVVVGGGFVASRVATSAARVTPASLTQQTPLVTTVTDRNGAPIATIFDQYRLPLAPADVPTVLKAAVVSIEDRRFYSEHGIDPAGVLRALINDRARGHARQSVT